MPKNNHDHADEAIGIFLMVIGLLLGISLLTYHIEDRSFSTLSSSPRIQNAVGKVGAAVSDLFFQLVGVGAYLFPFFLIALGWKFFRTEGEKIPRRAFVGFLLLVVTLSSFAESLKDRSAGAVPAPHLEGGGAGRLLSHFFLNY
ncbi:MAG TPA: DNA translocase FtsK 4TM domain-containing protein, partial [Candidatus Manganitrophaceae bacterium]|nr:DNA translocase FtsK 4TM domain-containing protein [Candidatus Manganitrophaceae bacterium]